VKIGEVTAVLFRGISDFIPLRSLLIFQFVGGSVLEICMYCCWVFIIFAKVGGEKAEFLLWAFRIWNYTYACTAKLWYFDSLCTVCVLCHGLQHS